MFNYRIAGNIKNYYTSIPVSRARIAAMVILFFILANIFILVGVKLYYGYHNERVQFGYRLPNKFVLIRKELPSVFYFIQKNMHSYDRNIILLGDSVSYGAGDRVEANENIGKYLEDNLNRELSGRKVKVWNLAMPGSKPGDTYFLYKKALELKPDLIIINFNYLFYTPSNIKSPLVYTWLVSDFDRDGRYREQVKHLLYPDPEHRLKFLFDQYLPVYHYRDLINALVFKDQPAKKFQGYVNAFIIRAEKILQAQPPAKTGAEPTNNYSAGKRNEWYYRDWSEQLKGIAWMYNNKPIDPKTNLSYLFTREIAADIKKNNINAIIFMAGQNHKLLKPLINNKDYEHNIFILNRLFDEHRVDYVNFDGRIEQGLFTDNVHLTAAGNKFLADDITGHVLKNLNSIEALK